MGGVKHPDLPAGRPRLLVAEVSGEVQRLVFGDLRGLPLEQAIGRLREITEDRVVLGHVLGGYLAQAERSEAFLSAVEMLRAAGADEQTAEVKAEWVRERYAAGRLL